jgi:hypothetical protein
MNRIARQFGYCVFLWAAATTLAFGGPTRKVEWKPYRYYFSNDVNAMGLGQNFVGPKEPAYYVIHSQSEWSAYWVPFFKPLSEAGAVIAPYPPIPDPPIDFSKFTLLIASTETKPTGGYSLEFASILDDEAALIVSLVETIPGKLCGLTTIITKPTASALVERTSKPIRFQVSTVTHECPG